MARLRINVTPSLQRLDLVVKGLVNTRFMGNYSSAFKGSGLEFADYRSYTPNDDANKIDWKASARAKKILIKEFIEERNLNIYFVVDVSSKMMLGSASKLKCEYVAELVASLSNTILRAGDHVGLTMIGDHIKKRISPQSGMKQFGVISQSLSDLKNYGGDFSLKKAMKEMLKGIEEGAFVIFISDFISDEDIKSELMLASKKFNFIGICVRDQVDMKLPQGMGEVYVENPETGESLLFTPNKFRELYGIETKNQISALGREFKKNGSDFLLLTTNKPFIEELVSFFKRREMRWR